VNNLPNARIDPFGADFIAVGNRPLNIPVIGDAGASHFSIAYFQTPDGDPSTPELGRYFWLYLLAKQGHNAYFSAGKFDDQDEGILRIGTDTAGLGAKAIGKIIGQGDKDMENNQNLAWGILAKKAGAIELLVDTGWKARKFHRTESRIAQSYFSTESVSISVIRYWDSAKYYSPVSYGSPEQVKNAWDKVVKLAKEYPFAEQPDSGKERDLPSVSFSGKFKNWPNSRYENAYVPWSDAKNSNSFIRTICTDMGWAIPPNLPGFNPGIAQPQKETPPRNSTLSGTWSGDPYKPK
jgi:hypothetical protein